MLVIEDLSKSFGSQTLFSDLNLNIGKGWRVGLLGRNGHGKSTLLKLILGEESADTGSIHFPQGYRLSHLSQHMAFSGDSLLHEAAQGLPSDDKHDLWKVEKTLSGLGFHTKDFDKPIDSFSGGWQLRVNLCRALVSQPDMLLLDEPTNFLDVSSVAWLVQFLRSWKSELILVSHDRHFVDSICSHLFGLHRHQGFLVHGNTETYYQKLSLEEETYERHRQKVDRKRKHMEDFVRRFRAKAKHANLAQSRLKMLAKQPSLEKLEKLPELSFSFPEAALTDKVLLEAHRLRFAYPSQNSLIDDLSLSLKAGDRLAIVGQNGAGKSTLLRLLSQELQPTRGHIKKILATQLSHFDQMQAEQLDPHQTVESLLMLSHDKSCRQSARQVAAAMMFHGNDALKKVGVLSGGERCRLHLGQILMKASNVLLLDEPTQHLDMESSESLIEALQAYQGAVVMVSHNEHFLHAIATRLLIFHNQAIIPFNGSYQTFINHGGFDALGSDQTENLASKSVHAKRQQRQRVAQLNDKWRLLLKPMKSQQASLEKDIAELETLIQQDESQMMEASQQSDGETINRCAQSLAKHRTQLETLFAEWENLSSEIQAKEKEWEEAKQSFSE